jgi:N-acetylglucosamine-6-sulfatase
MRRRRSDAWRLPLLLVAVLAWQPALRSTVAEARPRPDIVVIVTDDQRWDTMRYLPRTASWLTTSYPRAFVSNPSCCASRTTILTGTYSQDNGVWANKPPDGGWAAFQANGWPGHTIADALQASGYRTALLGKFLNHWDGTIPPGWDLFAAPLHAGAFPGRYLAPYYDYTLRVAQDGVATDQDHGELASDYSTTVLDRMADDYVRATPPDQPLFLYLAPPAPHAAGHRSPPIPAPADVGTPIHLPKLSPNVNEADVSDKPRFVARRPPIAKRTLDRWRRAQARTLLSVDRAIDDVMHTVAATRDLSNTLVLLLSDNGFSGGSHRLLAKGTAYDEVIRVPMRARFDGVLDPGKDRRLADNLDVAPTVAQAARIVFPTADGTSLLRPGRRDHLVIEGGLSSHHPFCGVRTSTALFVRYANREEEYYDLRADPFELHNDPTDQAADPLRAAATAECDPLPPGWPRASL